MQKRTYLKYILHAAILIGLIIAGIKYLNGPEILNALQTFNYRYAPFMLALELGYLLVRAWRFVVLTQSLADTPWAIIFRAYIAGQPASYLPGGIAARAGLMNEVNIPVEKASIPVIFASGLDQVVLITSALVAALWFEKARTFVLIILAVVVAIGVILLVPVSRHWLGQVAEAVARKFNMLEKWQNFLKTIPEVLTVRTLGTALALTIIAFAFDILTLDLAIRGVGFSIPYATIALVYFLPTVLGRLSGIPGGVGVTEAGMVGFLRTTSELSTYPAFAAVAIFRIAALLFPALMGALVYFFAWRGEKELAISTKS